MWKWITRIILSLAILLILVRVADRFSRRGIALPDRPAANAYPTVLALAKDVELPGEDLMNLRAEEVQRLASKNRNAAVRLHSEVRRDSGVELSTAGGWMDAHMTDLKSFKRLAGVLGVQSRAELLSGNTNAAAAAMLDVLLLGTTMSRGGVLVDSLTGLAVETFGMAGVRGLLPGVGAAFCRSAARELETLDANRDTPEQVLKAEKAWSQASFGLIQRAGGLLGRSALAQREADFVQRHHKAVRRTRQLTLLLAARALELERGSPVSKPQDLVPDVLTGIPTDPETGRVMTEIPLVTPER
jgi:hypothetical protein